jgi:hypothetical protein
MASSFAAQFLSLESIEFQSDLFFKELAMIFGTMEKYQQKEIAECAELGILSNAIAKRTGLKVVFDIGQIGPAVEIPKMNRNNVLVNSFLRNYINSSDGLKMISNASQVARGSVNLKTGTVTGVFTEVSSTVHYPSEMIAKTKFTAEEKAAMLLHELGHLMTFYEYMARTVTTNQVLSGVAKALDGSGTIAEREMVFISAKKALKLDELDASELAKTTSTKVAEMVVLTSAVQKSVSELGTNIYDFSTWEYLSDQFATRFCAGRHLALALDKIYRSTFNISYRNIAVYLTMEALKLTLLIASPFVGLILIAIDGRGDGTYDVPGARLKRIRNQIIEAIKGADGNEQDQLKADLVTIDACLSNIEDRRQLVGYLWDVLSPTARRAYSQAKLQQELEGYASNELFARAQEMKTLFA